MVYNDPLQKGGTGSIGSNLSELEDDGRSHEVAQRLENAVQEIWAERLELWDWDPDYVRPTP